MPQTKKKNKNEKNKAQKNGFSRWFRWLLPPIEGTVAEPWPTAEELWEDPEVQEEIKKFGDAIKYLKNNQNQQG